MSTPNRSDGWSLRILRGNPDPADIAALVTALAALQGTTTERAADEESAATARGVCGSATSWRNGQAVTWRSAPARAS